MGPFGTGVVIPMLPELRTEYGVSTEAVSLTFTMYFMPFALLLIISGTLGERFGKQKTLRFAFIAYGLASLLCAIAPTFSVLLAGRLLQGAANAFLTPLLLAGLVDVASQGTLGKVVGTYGLFQAGGGFLAPLAGGLAADTNWRLAFVAVGIASIVLTWSAPAGSVNPGGARPSLASLASQRMWLLGAGAFLMAFGPIGASVIVGLKLRDDVGLDGAATGWVFAIGSAVAMAASLLSGRLMDRLGVARVTVGSGLIAVLAVLAIAKADSHLTVAIFWAIAAGAAIGVTVVFQSLAAIAVPGNRGGAISTTLAFRFLGHGLGPLALTPLMANRQTVAFTIAAVVGLPAIGLLLLAGRRPRDVGSAGA